MSHSKFVCYVPMRTGNSPVHNFYFWIIIILKKEEVISLKKSLILFNIKYFNLMSYSFLFFNLTIFWRYVGLTFLEWLDYLGSGGTLKFFWFSLLQVYRSQSYLITFLNKIMCIIMLKIIIQFIHTWLIFLDWQFFFFLMWNKPQSWVKWKN